jgi:hypothetical protein
MWFILGMPPPIETKNVYNISPWHLIKPHTERLQLRNIAVFNNDLGENKMVPIDDPDRLWFTSVWWRGATTTMTQIDYIFVSSHLFERTSRYKVETSEGKMNDYRMVTGTINSARFCSSINRYSDPSRSWIPSTNPNCLTTLQQGETSPKNGPRRVCFESLLKKGILRIGLPLAKKRRKTNLQ